MLSQVGLIGRLNIKDMLILLGMIDLKISPLIYSGLKWSVFSLHVLEFALYGSCQPPVFANIFIGMEPSHPFIGVFSVVLSHCKGIVEESTEAVRAAHLSCL